MFRLLSKTSSFTGIGINKLFTDKGIDVDASLYTVLKGDTTIHLTDLIPAQTTYNGRLKDAVFKIAGTPPENEFLLGENIKFDNTDGFTIRGYITKKNGNLYATNADIKELTAYRDYDVLKLNLDKDGIYRLDNGTVLIVSDNYVNLPSLPTSELLKHQPALANGVFDWQLESLKRKAFNQVMDDLQTKVNNIDDMYRVLDTSNILTLIAYKTISLYEISNHNDEKLFTSMYFKELNNFRPIYEISREDGSITRSKLFRIKSF